MKQQFKIWFLAATIAVFAAACGGSGAPGGEPPNITTVLRVRVVDENNYVKLTGITVVLGDNTGAVVTTGTTDSNGEVTFTNPPSSATVTAVNNFTSIGTTYHHLSAYYEVNVSAVTLKLGNAPSGISGTAAINVTNSLAGAASWSVIPGGNIGTGSTNVTANISPADIQSDGKVSFAALGYDVGGNLIGYGVSLDQTFSNGMTQNISLNQTDLTPVSYTLTNYPATAASLETYVDVARKGINGYEDFSNPTAGVFPGSVNLHVMPNYGDSYRYQAYMNQNGIAEPYCLFENGSATLSAQSFDFSQCPTTPFSLSITNAGTVRPTMSWAGSDPASDVAGISVYQGGSAVYSYSLTAPTTKTSVVFPELPDSLAAFRPVLINGFDIYNGDLSVAAGYNDYLTKSDQQTVSIAEYTWREADSYYSTTQSDAPSMRKAVSFRGVQDSRRNKSHF